MIRIVEIIEIYLILWEADFINYSLYIEKVDELFLKHDNNDFLLELECCPGGIREHRFILNEYLYQNKIIVDSKEVGTFILKLLETIYKSNTMDLENFIKKAYHLCSKLPNNIRYDEPYDIFSYLDDCLLYDGEMRTRELLDEAFKELGN